MGLKSVSVTKILERKVLKSDQNGIEIEQYVEEGDIILELKSDQNGIEMSV